MPGMTATTVKVLSNRLAPGRHRNPAAIFAVRLPGGIVVHVMMVQVRRNSMELRLPDAGDRKPGVVLPEALRKQVEAAVHRFAREQAGKGG